MNLNNNKRIDLVGVQIDFGASRKGVAMGPLAIRYANIKENLEDLGYDVYDKGDIIPPREGEDRKNMLRFDQVVETNKQVYQSVRDSLKEGRIPIVMGGDHSIGAGSVAAVAKHYEKEGKIGVIWIDAHGDWNSDKTTITGNMHGMPFSAVCGWGPDEMVDYGQKPCFVEPSHAAQVGGRDFDPKEADRMKQAGLNVYPIYDIDKRGMRDVMEQAIADASNGTVGIHLSFDVDAITPEYAPGTGTPVENGITAREALLAVKLIAKSGKLLSMDIVEVNPILDERNKTAKLATELVLAALGKVDY
ncbi:MAG: arginase [Clostridiales bacterium]|nr:arginase [Candidatus Crickella equi]